MKELLKELGFEDLPTLNDFRLKLNTRSRLFCTVNIEQYCERFNLYGNFITQPLTKGMFVPCDEDGNVLREPNGFSDNDINAGQTESYSQQYQQAKERVLFEGFEFKYVKQFDSELMFWAVTHNGTYGGSYENWYKTRIKQKPNTATIEQAINAGVKLTPKQ